VDDDEYIEVELIEPAKLLELAASGKMTEAAGALMAIIKLKL
jgi:hypothetical protein